MTFALCRVNEVESICTVAYKAALQSAHSRSIAYFQMQCIAETKALPVPRYTEITQSLSYKIHTHTSATREDILGTFSKHEHDFYHDKLA